MSVWHLALVPLLTPLLYAATPQAVTCNTSAFILDQDPKGIAVRSGPSLKHTIVRKLSPQPEPPMLTIRQGLGNWMRVSDIHTSKGHLLLPGQGWLYGPTLAVRIYGSEDEPVPLYQHPDTRTRVTGLTQAGQQLRITGCNSAWLKVKDNKTEGWLHPDDQCGKALTPCRKRR